MDRQTKLINGIAFAMSFFWTAVIAWIWPNLFGFFYHLIGSIIFVIVATVIAIITVKKEADDGSEELINHLKK